MTRSSLKHTAFIAGPWMSKFVYNIFQLALFNVYQAMSAPVSNSLFSARSQLAQANTYLASQSPVSRERVRIIYSIDSDADPFIVLC
jgi:hypothetical protein